MTISPEYLKTEAPELKDFDALSRMGPLEDLFYLGYANSEKIIVYEDKEKNITLTVTFRTLTPLELRDIYESCGKFSTFGGQDIVQKIETLARAIKTINDMPLILNEKERTDFFEKNKNNPTPLEMARIIIIDKLQSVHLLDMLYEAYQIFSDKIKEHFDDIKKKLKTPQSSKLT